MMSRDRTVAIFAMVGIICICIGLGAAFGWAFGVLAIGIFAFMISVVAA